MIEKIIIKHFQAHKSTEIELGDVTILRGPSDSGKSSIVRALSAFFNCSIKPENAFRGEYPVEITLVSNGQTVTMLRNSKTTLYRLNGQEFSKVNKKCPDEIKEFLGIKEYSIDLDEKIFLQIQSQFDKPFLLSESPSTIAKIIGRLSNLNVVLCASRGMYADNQAEKQNIKLLTEQKRDAERDLHEYANVDAFKKLLDAAEKRYEEIEKGRKLLEEYTRVFDELSSLEPKLQEETERYTVLETQVVENLPKLIDCAERLQEYEEIEASTKALAKEPTDFELGAIPENIDSLIEMKAKVKALSEVLEEFAIYNRSTSSCGDYSSDEADNLFESLFSSKDTLLAYETILDEGSKFNLSLRKFKEMVSQYQELEAYYASALSETLPTQCKNCQLLNL